MSGIIQTLFTASSGAAQLNFPLLGNITTTAKDDSSSTISVNLPSGIASGNGLIIILTAHDGGTFTTPSGWTQITNTKNTSNNGPRTAVYACVATGSEGSTQNISIGTAKEATAISARITSWFGSISNGIEGTSNQQTTTTPNPPSLTASWGSAKNLWIAFVGSRGSRILISYPTNYSLYQTQALNPGVASDRGETFMAGRQLEINTEDPGTFSFDDTAREVVVGTLVIRGT